MAVHLSHPRKQYARQITIFSCNCILEKIQIQMIITLSFPSGLSILILHMINIIRMTYVCIYRFRASSFLNRQEVNKHNVQLLRTFGQLRKNNVHFFQTKFIVEYRPFFLLQSHSFYLQISFCRCPSFLIFSFLPFLHFHTKGLRLLTDSFFLSLSHQMQLQQYLHGQQLQDL